MDRDKPVRIRLTTCAIELRIERIEQQKPAQEHARDEEYYCDGLEALHVTEREYELENPEYHRDGLEVLDGLKGETANIEPAGTAATRSQSNTGDFPTDHFSNLLTQYTARPSTAPARVIGTAPADKVTHAYTPVVVNTGSKLVVIDTGLGLGTYQQSNRFLGF